MRYRFGIINPDHTNLAGVYAAAVTPLRDSALDLDSVSHLLKFLASRGCHGAVLFGTTGEGPSFSPTERLEALRSALLVRQKHPQFACYLAQAHQPGGLPA
jgi:4-hydroxy-tetrahydrodipicolinate synthase